jgi:hypothetical protein
MEYSGEKKGVNLITTLLLYPTYYKMVKIWHLCLTH